MVQLDHFVFYEQEKLPVFFVDKLKTVLNEN